MIEKQKPATVFDVAAYILEKQAKQPPLTAWKLQKLVYYCQAWSLVWNSSPMFKERILAWANGPVVKELYEQHKGLFYVEKINKGNPALLTPLQKDTIDRVYLNYKKIPPSLLSELTHLENPWKEAREGLKPGERGQAEIKLHTIQEYYSSIDPSYHGG